MIKGKKVLGVILARIGSKGVREKNIRKVCGHPLISYSIYQFYDFGSPEILLQPCNRLVSYTVGFFHLNYCILAQIILIVLSLRGEGLRMSQAILTT